MTQMAGNRAQASTARRACPLTARRLLMWAAAAGGGLILIASVFSSFWLSVSFIWNRPADPVARVDVISVDDSVFELLGALSRHYGDSLSFSWPSRYPPVGYQWPWWNFGASGWWTLRLPLWIPYLALLTLSLLLWRIGRPRRFRAGHCQSCGYDLTGNTSGRCPECGSSTAAMDNGAQAGTQGPIRARGPGGVFRWALSASFVLIVMMPVCIPFGIQRGLTGAENLGNFVKYEALAALVVAIGCFFVGCATALVSPASETGTRLVRAGGGLGTAFLIAVILLHLLTAA